jgi:hypothetical protein
LEVHQIHWSCAQAFSPASFGHWSISSTFLHAAFSRLFCAQLIATCEWRPAQPAQLSATWEWHNQHNFCMKKHGKINFQKQAAFFCLSHKKAKMLMKFMPGWFSIRIQLLG